MFGCERVFASPQEGLPGSSACCRSLRLSGTTVTALALFLVATVASVDAQGTADAPVIAQSQTALPPSALAGFSVVSASGNSCWRLERKADRCLATDAEPLHWHVSQAPGW